MSIAAVTHYILTSLKLVHELPDDDKAIYRNM